MSEYVVTDTELTAVANAIRTKGGTSADLEWNADFISAINAISGGGGAKNILKGTDAPTANIGSDGDVYLQYYNDDIEIPTGYTRLTNIVADGRQYIDSNVIPTYNTKLEFDMIIQKYVAPSASFLFGTRSGLTFESTTGNNQNADSFMLQIGSEKATINKMEHFSERIKVTYDKTGIVIKDKNGTVLQSASMNALSGTATNSMYIFCLRGYAGSTNIKGTIYRVKIYESDVLIRDYIPTSRDSDNVCGLYDVQNDTFTPSASATPFISGAQFEQNEIIATYCKVNGAWQMLEGTDIDDVNTEGGGASNYELLDYIQSDGTQVIDLGVKCLSGEIVGVKCLPNSGISGYRWVFGASYSANSVMGLQFDVPTGVVKWHYGTGSNNRGTIDYSVPAVLCANTIASDTANNVYALSINAEDATSASRFIGKLYYVTVGDNVFLPCRRKSDGVCGLWDSTNSQFLTDSAGGNAFVAGNVIYEL